MTGVQTCALPIYRPAAEWGAEFNALLSKHGMQHVAATVLLPRHEVILRQISLPGVSDKDLDAAVSFQLDGLHPYNEADVLSAYARLEGSGAVAVAIARRELVEGYTTLFAEAGVKLAGFTASGVAMHSALRLYGTKPSANVFAVQQTDRGLEVYGESAAKPLLSATFELTGDSGLQRAQHLAAAELRFEEVIAPMAFGELLHGEPALPFAAALSSACPWLSSRLNLLPEDQRVVRSPWQWVPTVALTAAVVLAGVGLQIGRAHV